MATSRSNLEQRKAEQRESSQEHKRDERRMYLRFGAMILTAMMAMYALTYVTTYAFAHVRFSETRLYVTLIMGASMAMIMLAFMLGMYKNKKVNAIILAGAVALGLLGTFLVRSQATIQDPSYMRAMIPHHSIAILTSENSQIDDLRVCELAVAIIEAQKREISEMEWLIADIERNGPARTAADAAQRPIPEFRGFADRTCAAG